MAYKAFIKTGKGNNLTTVESIVLPTKERLSAYVKRSPVGNANTDIEVFDLEANKLLRGKKRHFSNSKFW